MSKAAGLFQNLGNALRNLGIKAPWQITGPTSSPEYLSHLPKAVEYRVHAPASQPVRAAVPQAETDRVYNIKYYSRDSRRAELPGGTKVLERSVFTPESASDGEAAPPQMTPGAPYRWSGPPRSILDVDHNGYTL